MAANKPPSPEEQKTSTQPNIPLLEEEMAAYWQKKNIFERSIEERSEKKTFVFYDGPPFATGLPHYGHLLQSVVKDAIPRYKTMQGYRVPRRWGWDCHGLPVENLIEKELKLKSKRDIEAYGIEGFTNACKLSVFQYVEEWKRYVSRLGRWVDMDHAYRTLDPEYIESVWWVFAELHQKKYVYKDRRVSLYCTRCATPLSSFEISMGNSYADHEDPAVTIKFKERGKDNAYFLAWTTTPWTLPANTALAVHPEVVYVSVKIAETGETLTFAESRMSDVLSQFFPLEDPHQGERHENMPFQIVARYTGSELEGRSYEPLYDFFSTQGGYQVVTADYVSAEDGTGMVHIAPAFGEEDMQTGKKHNLLVLETLDADGRFVSEVTPWAGMFYKDANAPIMEDLASRGLLYRQKTISHSMPICWRCSTVLLYRAQPAWFVDIAKLKSKMLAAANKIEWHPHHFKDGRFGKGLESAPDWNVSRTRYWGAPIPVWECDLCDERAIIGSIAELKKRAQGGASSVPLDVHRPAIDAVTLACGCGGVMRRVPEVFDCWFESGAMPYAAVHHPFESEQSVQDAFPADFIGEAVDQTRGWFYVLHVLATALMNKPAFKHVIVTGHVMAEDGKKMSKSLKNYPDPWEVLTTYGADALRLYMLSSPIMEAESMNFSLRDLDEVRRKILLMLWNVATFYKTYAGNDAVELAKPRSAHVLDRWLYARLHGMLQEMTEAYERYELARAVRPLRAFVDDLSTWWLRRSRDRIRSGGDADDRMDALKTLREVLLDLSAAMAPATPFMADRIYLDLGGSKASVHLEAWPKSDKRLIDDGLLADMARIRAAATAGLEQRAVSKIPVRQALASATVFLKDTQDTVRLGAKTDLLALLRDELNVEEIRLHTDASVDGGRVELDTVITPELKEKGMARELVRRFMALRKEAKLSPADHIIAHAASKDAAMRAMLERLSASVAPGIKAASVEVGTDASESTYTVTLTLDDAEVTLGIRVT
jgi:isoleucyl-tRNA synthetase